MKQPLQALVLLFAAALVACAGPAGVEESTAAGSPGQRRQPPAAEEDVEPPAGAESAVALECPESDTRATIVLRGCDTGVANAEIGGCTLADHLLACESGPPADVPRCVAKTTERWVETGVLRGEDKGLIQACAADDRETDDGRPPGQR